MRPSNVIRFPHRCIEDAVREHGSDAVHREPITLAEQFTRTDLFVILLGLVLATVTGLVIMWWQQ